MKFGPLRTFIYCWIMMLDCLIGIFTLGNYVPNLSLRFLFWAERKYLQKIKRKDKP